MKSNQNTSTPSANTKVAQQNYDLKGVNLQKTTKFVRKCDLMNITEKAETI
jgi:SUMO ligase MMS21 Smc5/6 complex component